METLLVRKQYLPKSDVTRPSPLASRRKIKAGLFGRMVTRSDSRFNIIENSIFFTWAVGSQFVARPLDTDAEPNLRSSFDVYFITRTPDTAFNTAHWSLYTQGHFYHLSAETQAPSDIPSSCSIRFAVAGTDIVLKDDDYSSRGDGTKSPDSQHRKMLVAYHIGQTDYTPPEILEVAQQIINEMTSYNLFRRNCQHFMSTLAMNILMRRRDNSLFMGTAEQIVDWDSGSKHTGNHSNGLAQVVQVVVSDWNSLMERVWINWLISEVRKHYDGKGHISIDPSSTSPWEQFKTQFKYRK